MRPPAGRAAGSRLCRGSFLEPTLRRQGPREHVSRIEAAYRCRLLLWAAKSTRTTSSTPRRRPSCWASPKGTRSPCISGGIRRCPGPSSTSARDAASSGCAASWRSGDPSGRTSPTRHEFVRPDQWLPLRRRSSPATSAAGRTRATRSSSAPSPRSSTRCRPTRRRQSTSRPRSRPTCSVRTPKRARRRTYRYLRELYLLRPDTLLFRALRDLVAGRSARSAVARGSVRPRSRRRLSC